MSDTDSRIRALILAYEDLDAEDRRRADELLARDAGLRQKLSRLQELEAWAKEPVPSSDAGILAGERLSAEDERQLEASLEALMQRLGLPADTKPVSASSPSTASSPTASSPPTAANGIATARLPRRGLRRSWAPLAAAAVLLLLVWAPWNVGNPVRFSDAEVVAVETTTNASRSAQDARSFNSGEAFALSFRLEATAGVIVYHVDPSGSVSLVFPGSTSEAILSFEAGASQRIPSTMSEEQWVLGREAGRESFLLAAVEDADLDLELLDQEIHQLLSGVDDRQLVVENLETLLEDRLATVQLIEFDHLP